MLSTNSRLESTVEPVKVQLEIPESGETEVEPQIIPAIIEESPAQMDKDKPVLQVRYLPPSSQPTDR